MIATPRREHLIAGEEQKLLPKEGKPAQNGMLSWMIAPVCAILVVAGTEPYMMYSLYHTQLKTTLGLTDEQAGDVQGYGTIGGLCLAFIPGIIYDRFGFVASLVTGGTLSTLGAMFWYVLLVEGGQPGNPSWHSLAASFLLLGLGTRFLFITGVCAVLDTFPAQYAARLSSIMSFFSACGALAFPIIWRVWYLPSEKLPVPETHPAHPRLMPVAHFHLMLVLVYIGATVAGLCVGPLLPRKGLDARPFSVPFAGRRLMTAPAVAMLVMCVAALPCVYEYLGSAMAPLGKKALTDAGVPPETAHEVQASMTTKVATIGLVGRVVVGLVADFLQHTPGFQSASMYIMYFLFNLATFLGFTLLMVGHIGSATSVGLWSAGTYVLAFAFSGYFALLGGSVRMWFPKNEIGTWLGFFLCLIGLCNFCVARLAAAADFSAAFWQVAVFAAAVCSVTLGHFAYVHYLKDKERVPAPIGEAEEWDGAPETLRFRGEPQRVGSP